MSGNSTFVLIAQNGSQFQFQTKNIYALQLNALKLFILYFSSKKMKNFKCVCGLGTDIYIFF